MGFATFCFLTWLATALFVVLPKQLSLIENTFVYLVIMIFSINFSWIFIEEYHFMELTKNGMKYTAYLLVRSVLLPMLLIIYLNFLQKVHERQTIILLTAASIGIMVGVTYLSTFFNFLEYRRWNHAYDAVYFLLLHLLAVSSFKLIKKVSESAVEYT